MRKSGVLLHITSLPSRGGIGTMGASAREFIDFAADAGLNIWQMLPVGCVDPEGSPYKCTSIYAGNELLIDFEEMEADDLLPKGAYAPLPNTDRIDFAAVRAQNASLLRMARAYSHDRIRDDLSRFAEENTWVRDYALFRALQDHFHGESWMNWPEGIRRRQPDEVERYTALLRDAMEDYIFCQYVFFLQWDRLHAYAKAKSIALMGDMPIYVSDESCDVWLNPELFELDDDLRPIRIAGVPPDAFQPAGQLWGNPLYRWDAHEKTGYAWWISRFRAQARMFDILRVDHFIGFANYFAVPAGAKDALGGKYEKGPGRKLFQRVERAVPELRIVAEDLGVVSGKVCRLLKACGYPGMKVLQFAFDSDEKNPYLPAQHTVNSVIYTGTHDNNTTLGWWADCDEKTRAFARRALHMHTWDDDIVSAMLKCAWGSICDTAIAPMQDLLMLDGSARMNLPGTVGGNWTWRMTDTDYAPIARRIRILNRRYNRGSAPQIDVNEIADRAREIIECKYHVTLPAASAVQLHEGVSDAVMIAIAPMWADDHAERCAHRRAIYLSAEYLMGRMIYSNLYSLGILEPLRDALSARGASLADLEDIEDAALGNGGLGRLAACFLDSAATHNIPLDGYGLRYRYGLFHQEFIDGHQIELPDDWTKYGDPWSIRRDALSVTVPMKGLTVRAVPYDMPVIGYGGRNFSTLRLWQCESDHAFDFDLFNAQDYAAASRDKNAAEDITKLLYPNDSLRAGKLMRIRQQYVLCSASLQDMLRAYRENFGDDYAHFADQYAVQLNDTHPTMAIPELIRLLTQSGMAFADAFAIAQRTFRYTNHTVMREALECWDIDLLREVAPDMVRVIRKIDAQLSRMLKKNAIEGADAMRIIRNGRVHMANLAVYGSCHVNGVAAIHSQILKDDVFREWYAVYPDRFCNKTNGITQRRWLGLCNPELCDLIRDTIGDGAMLDLNHLSALRDHIDDDLARRFIQVKREKKRQLAAEILKREGVVIPEHFIFSVQVKRLHEYKRQLLNALSIWDIYCGVKEGSIADFPPTAFIFGAKSAPGYARAKAIILLINRIAAIINADDAVNDRMRVVFCHNYNCSYAEKIIPAADISEQISPAGTEASGTGNMKLMLNGAVTLGTRDGANIEIFEQAGEENNFPFGATVDELNAIREAYDPMAIYASDARIRRAVDVLANASVTGEADDPHREGAISELRTALLEGASWHKPDHYFLLKDFNAYREARLKALHAAQDEIAFAKLCLYNIAGAGKFSSDRTIAEYADEIWQVE